MRDNTIRLRLVVRRHALPEVRVVFSIQTENDPTIANLLEQVNEIVPLESNDWGLEDYAVELRDVEGSGFECMHFQNVATVLKNDEQVVIRPLVTEDRKKRRLSGRHQISSDGKHLIDGIAFGRPRLKTPRDRPAIDIPPLKRRRITYDAGDSEPEPDSDDEGPQLLLTEHGEQQFGNLPFDEAEDEDEEDEFVEEQADDVDEELDDVDPEEIEDELRDLHNDIAAVGDVDLSEVLEGLGDQRKDSTGLGHTEVEDQRYTESAPVAKPQEVAGKAAGADGLDLPTLDKITALRAAFPTAPADICEKTLLACNKQEKKAYNRLRKAHPAQLSLHDMRSHLERLRAAVPDAGDDVSGGEDGSGDESEAESVNSLVKHYDEHGFPVGSILDGTASRHMVESLRKSGHEVKIPVHTRFDESDEEEATSARAEDKTQSDLDEDMEAEREKSDEDDSSDSGGSSSDSSDDGEFNPADDDFDGLDDFDGVAGSSESDSESGSDEDSDSGPEVASSRQAAEPQGGAMLSDARSNSRKRRREIDSDEEQEDSSDSEDESDSSDSSSSDSDSDSESDSDSGSSDGSCGGAGNGGAFTHDPDSDSGSDSSDSENSSDSSSDSEPEGQSSSAPKTKGTGYFLGAQSPDIQASGPEEASNANLPVNQQIPKPQSPQAPNETVPPGQGKTSTQRRNARRRAQKKAKKDAARDETLDPNGTTPDASVAAKKAALLRSLGLEADVANEQPVHDRDTGDIASEHNAPSNTQITAVNHSGTSNLASSLSQPESQPHIDQENSTAQGSRDEEDQNESWRSKINYYGVECCREGVELSEPPFPFVQRWDPQQRYSKRKQRAQPEYYEEESQPSTKKRRQTGYSPEGDSYFEGDSYMSACYESENANITLNYDDDPSEFPAFNTTEQEQHHHEDDLVSLPDDLSALPVLERGELCSGMAVAWKQLLLSKATGWQPQIQELAGMVVDVDGDYVRVRLAKKFRDLEENEKDYDEHGNRVYDKFEHPGMDDEDHDAQMGYRDLEIADMIELRVLKRPIETVSQDTTASNAADNQPPQEKGDSEPARGESTTLDHEVSQSIQKSADRMEIDSQDIRETQDSNESVIPETYHDATEEPQPAQPLRAEELPTEELPISEDRRQEISQLISDAGFRKEVDPSITEERLDLSSPSRQLEEMAQEMVSSPRLPRNAAKTETQSTKLSQNPSNFSSFNESQPILLEPFNGFSDDIEGPSEGRVGYPNLGILHPDVGCPKLDVPHSDNGSVLSGRQPDPDYSIELGHDDAMDHPDPEQESGEEVEPEHQPQPGTQPEQQASRSADAPAVGMNQGLSSIGSLLTRRDESSSRSTSESSVSTFPSIGEIMQTASSARSSGTPCIEALLSSQKARKSSVAPNLEYEEAMRRLESYDNPDDVGEAPVIKTEPVRHARLSSVAHSLAKPIEKPSPRKPQAKVVKAEPGVRVAPPPRPRISSRASTQQASSSQFSIPQGSQLVSLLSSSPEPEVTEDYAEDSIDETYMGDSPVSQETSWTSKKTRRGVSLPASSIPREISTKNQISASQGRQSLGVSYPSLRPTGKKKTIARAF
ncbi:hypothetical protein OQA88_11773 [Cercophora sp. LCS_1]